MPPQDKIKALLGKAFKGAGASTAKEKEEKKKKEKENASKEAQEATSAVAAAAATTITTTTATITTTTTPPVAPAASASACAFLPASAPASTTTASAPVASVFTSATAVSAASVPAPAPTPTPTHRPSPGQQPPSGSVRCGRCGCRYFPVANNSLACYHHPGAVFFRHASQRGYIPSLDMVDRPYEPQAFVWTCCRGVVGQSSGCVYRRHVPAGAQGPAGRGGVSPRMNFRGENAGAFEM
ncbi:hypothetical protein DL770_000775 [Monosporascus sp. CRB-9-2]|nr:hypothetical protein DL770_000775 [Monosporascus sp. CRB-9-2]